MSFTYVRNNRGPNTLPCVTPQVIGLKFEIDPIFSACFLSLRKDLKLVSWNPLTP